MVKLQDMSGIVFTIVLIGIFLGVGLLVLNEFMMTSSVNGTQAQDAINTTIGALAGFPGWLPIIVTVIAASIILTVVIGGFVGGEGRGL